MFTYVCNIIYSYYQALKPQQRSVHQIVCHLEASGQGMKGGVGVGMRTEMGAGVRVGQVGC